MTRLQQARTYVKEHIGNIKTEERPVFHATPDVGWMNDPNAFSVYGEEYQLFYQMNPYDIIWGPMYWGHMKSRDLVTWERLPVALAPDEPYESGCFSGTTAETESGDRIIMYTAHKESEKQNGSAVVQSQCIAIGNENDFVKNRNNPVITADLLPDGYSESDFRDPKIWREGKKWFALIAARKPDRLGALVLFQSADLVNWTFENTIFENKGLYGGMWECPDFFRIDGKDFLIISAMDMVQQGMGFFQGHTVIYAAGQYDTEKKDFSAEKVQMIDYGPDFYAPETLLTADGRRIMIAWMQNWNNYLTPSDFSWSGMMTVPRELSYKDGILYQTPIRELVHYFANPVCHGNCRISPGQTLKFDDVSGRVLNLELKIKRISYHELTIRFAEKAEFHTSVIINHDQGTLTFSRKNSGMENDRIPERTIKIRETDSRIKLRLILDRFSAEIFVNDGEQVMSALLFTAKEADGISFSADGDAVIDIEKNDILTGNTDRGKEEMKI